MSIKKMYELSTKHKKHDIEKLSHIVFHVRKRNIICAKAYFVSSLKPIDFDLFRSPEQHLF